jgi:hypothetical protein
LEAARFGEQSGEAAPAIRLVQLTACPNVLMLNVMIRSESMQSARREYELLHRILMRNSDGMNEALRETFGGAIPEWATFRPIAISISPAQGASERAFAAWSRTASLIRELQAVGTPLGDTVFLGAIPLEMEFAPEHFEDARAWFSAQHDVLVRLHAAAASQSFTFRFRTAVGSGEGISLGTETTMVPVVACSGSDTGTPQSDSP